MLNPEVKAEWLKRLRSGDYQQGNGSLRQTDEGRDSWCCLGVLCDVIDPSGWDSESIGKHLYYGPMSKFPNSHVIRWASKKPGSEEDPVLKDGLRHCARMNDSGKPFTKIAGWIQENL